MKNQTMNSTTNTSAEVVTDTNKEYTTTDGVGVTRFTTKELAEMVLAMPGTMFSFATSLKDSYRDEVANMTQTANPWPWYGIVCARMFDTYSVFINRSTIIGGAPFMFDLPDYDNDIDAGIGEEQSEECLQDMIDGLTAFNLKYGELPDTWYVNEREQDNITILYNGRE